jgi:hypothetical protein
MRLLAKTITATTDQEVGGRSTVTLLHLRVLHHERRTIKEVGLLQ